MCDVKQDAFRFTQSFKQNAFHFIIVVSVTRLSIEKKKGTGFWITGIDTTKFILYIYVTISKKNILLPKILLRFSAK